MILFCVNLSCYSANGEEVKRTNVGTRELWCKSLEGEVGELIEGVAKFVHEDTPFSRIAF